MKQLPIALLWFVLMLLPQPAKSEDHQGFTFKLVHPNNADLIKNDHHPNDLHMWRLFATRSRNGIEKFWVQTRPLFLLGPANIKEVKYEVSAFSKAERIIFIALDQVGSEKFKQITSLHHGERIAMFWNGQLLQAPVVRQTVAGGVFVIEVYDKRKARELFDEIQLVKKTSP